MIKANPFVRGFRRVPHVMHDDLSEGALFRENIRRLAGTGLPFDLCVLPHQIAKAAALADLAPDVSFVLAGIACRPNVTVKLSGLPA